MAHPPINELISLTGKVAIVTGGAMGIGRGIVERLAEAGATVVIADLDGAAAEAAAQELGGSVRAIATDVSDEAAVQQLVAQTVQDCGSIDILVNNAGIYPAMPVLQMTAADFDKVIAVNLRSVFLTTHAVASHMIERKRGGRIINITSIDALHPSSMGLAHYDASKHGVWGFTKNVALELAPHQIWVNAIAPGGIATPGVQKASQGAGQGVDMQAMMDAFLKKIPMHRFGEPDDIGRAALFLASDFSSYMTGTQIVVDGGVLLS